MTDAFASESRRDGAELGKLFGGVKDSGHGREGAGLEEVTYLKQVYIDYHGRPRMAQVGADEVVQRLMQESGAPGESVFGERSHSLGVRASEPPGSQ